jgi:glucose-1-phosphate cytidylyltransferase
MDTFREYQYLNELWASAKTPWKVWSDEGDPSKGRMAAAKKAGAV